TEIDAVARASRFIGSPDELGVMFVELRKTVLKRIFHHWQVFVLNVQYSLSRSHQVFLRIRMIPSNKAVLTASGIFSPNTIYMGSRVKHSCGIIPSAILNMSRRKFLLPANPGSSFTTSR